MRINKLQATVKFNTVYTCSLCGKQGIGDTVRLEFNGSSADELRDYINNTHQSSNHMPVGWSFHSTFTCMFCKDNQ